MELIMTMLVETVRRQGMTAYSVTFYTH